MGFIARHKLLLILIVIVVAGVAWWAMSGGGSSPSTSLLTTEGSEAGLSPADQNLIATLLQLRAVKLDGTIFSEPAFSALKDFSTQIVAEPVGRPNPFAPLSSAGASSGSSARESVVFTPSR